MDSQRRRSREFRAMLQGRLWSVGLHIDPANNIHQFPVLEPGHDSDSLIGEYTSKIRLWGKVTRLSFLGYTWITYRFLDLGLLC